MSETPEMQDLARRFLDLWQEQMTLMATGVAASDKADDFFAAWQSMMQGGMPGMFAGGMPGVFPMHDAAMSPGAQPPGGERMDDDTAASAEAGAGMSPGAASVGTASDDHDELVHKLTRRIEQLESRITALEELSVPSKPASKSRGDPSANPGGGKKRAKKSRPGKPPAR